MILLFKNNDHKYFCPYHNKKSVISKRAKHPKISVVREIATAMNIFIYFLEIS